VNQGLSLKYRHRIPESDLERRKNWLWRSFGAWKILSRSSSYGEKLSSEKQARGNFNKLLSTILECDVYRLNLFFNFSLFWDIFQRLAST